MPLQHDNFHHPSTSQSPGSCWRLPSKTTRLDRIRHKIHFWKYDSNFVIIWMDEYVDNHKLAKRVGLNPGAHWNAWRWRKIIESRKEIGTRVSRNKLCVCIFTGFESSNIANNTKVQCLGRSVVSFGVYVLVYHFTRWANWCVLDAQLLAAEVSQEEICWN